MSSLSVGTWSTSFTAVLPGAWSLQGLVADALGALSTAPMSSTSSACVTLPEASFWPLEPALPGRSSQPMTDRAIGKTPASLALGGDSCVMGPTLAPGFSSKIESQVPTMVTC